MSVKGLQCGSPLAMRTRDPPIIQVEFFTTSPRQRVCVLSAGFISLVCCPVLGMLRSAVTMYRQTSKASMFF